MNVQSTSAKKRRRFGVILAVLAVLGCLLAVILSFRPDGTEAKQNLMDGVAKGQACVPEIPDAGFISAETRFSVRLFQKAAKADSNSLLSPVSVALALGMTANGAQGNTLKEFETLLGGMSISRMNPNFTAETNRLKTGNTGKIHLADSIWYRNKGLTVRSDFLQTNAEYFNAAAYRLDFSGKGAPQTINGWVRDNTGGKIDRMVGEISPDTVMYLINAMDLEQDWAVPYSNSTDGTFHTPKGNVSAKFMNSIEPYLHDGSADGVLKPLKDSRYAFAAVLPKKGTSLNQFIQSLTGDSFLALMRSVGEDYAISSIPKFRYDFSADLNQPLKDLGLKSAFDPSSADFSKMASTADGNIYISDVQHKAFIQVDELGVKAGAATTVAMGASSPDSSRMKCVIFDRPFLYAVVDTKTQLPVFLGTVADPAAQ